MIIVSRIGSCISVVSYIRCVVCMWCGVSGLLIVIVVVLFCDVVRCVIWVGLLGIDRL